MQSSSQSSFAPAYNMSSSYSLNGCSNMPKTKSRLYRWQILDYYILFYELKCLAFGSYLVYSFLSMCRLLINTRICLYTALLPSQFRPSVCRYTQNQCIFVFFLQICSIPISNSQGSAATCLRYSKKYYVQFCWKLLSLTLSSSVRIGKIGWDTFSLLDYSVHLSLLLFLLIPAGLSDTFLSLHL